jgi:hypothetical protein
MTPLDLATTQQRLNRIAWKSKTSQHLPRSISMARGVWPA